jgi:hypothetical protein
MTDEEIQESINTMRTRAARVGPQHAFWEIIFEAEAMLKGEQTLLDRSEIEMAIFDALKGNH